MHGPPEAASWSALLVGLHSCCCLDCIASCYESARLLAARSSLAGCSLGDLVRKDPNVDLKQGQTPDGLVGGRADGRGGGRAGTDSSVAGRT